MGVGMTMKILLRDRNMTIRDLATAADVPANTLYSITRRDSQRVDPVILQRVATALGVSVADLSLRTPSSPASTESLFDNMLALWGSINTSGRRRVLAYMRDISEVDKYKTHQ